MTVDLNKSNKDYAIFLPSISAVYARFISGYYSIENGPRKGVHPKGIPSFEDLNFLNPNSLFYYNQALYSAGHAALDPNSSDKCERMVQKRDRNNTFILGDSGGYQIARGILDFDWKDFNGEKSNKMRKKILTWLEHTSDYAMILDIPTWGIGKVPGIESFRSCLEGTLFNSEYFIRNRTGKCKFLNVLQGRTLTESNLWFDEVKDLPFEGWALGGNNMKDFEMILNRLIIMRDGKYLEENVNGDKRNWLHFLGISKLDVACAFTELQRILRKQVDEKLSISFDSATAFITVAHGQILTRNVLEKKRFQYLSEKMHDEKHLVGSDIPFPWESEVGRHLTIGDICVKPEGYVNKQGKESKTSWDSYSYILLMAHNVERHIKAVQQANHVFSLPHSQRYPFMPAKLSEIRDVIDEVFNSEKPFDIIKKHHKLLNNFSGSKTGKGVTTENLNSLFDFGDKIIEDGFDTENQDDSNLLEIEKSAEKND